MPFLHCLSFNAESFRRLRIKPVKVKQTFRCRILFRPSPMPCEMVGLTVNRQALCRYLLLPCSAEPGNQHNKRATDKGSECSFIRLAHVLSLDQ